jgi:hypothetical protein
VRERKIMELIQGHYYWDEVNGGGLIFEEEIDGYYWFYFIEEDRHVAYYEYELENLRRY